MRYTAALALLLYATPARADLPPGITCEMIRAHVAEHGRLQALIWARRQGYTIAQINEARKCLR